MKILKRIIKLLLFIGAIVFFYKKYGKKKPLLLEEKN